MKTLTKIGIAAVVATATLAGAAVAQDAVATVEQRIKLFEDMNAQWEPLAPMAGRAPVDAARVAAAVEAMRPIAEQIPATFTEDTSAAQTRQRSLPGIWRSKDDFDGKMTAFLTGLDALGTAAAGGNDREIKRQLQMVGRSCGACHDLYRAPDQ